MWYAQFVPQVKKSCLWHWKQFLIWLVPSHIQPLWNAKMIIWIHFEEFDVSDVNGNPIDKNMNMINKACEAYPLNMLHWLTWKWLSIFSTCLSCQNGCMGISRYTSDKSDFHGINSSPGTIWWSSSMSEPKCLILSRGKDPISFLSIKFNKNGSLLWFVTRQSEEPPSLGTTCKGMEYILGKRESKPGEYQFLGSSTSHCERKNSACIILFGVLLLASYVSGLELRINVKGQKPFHMPLMTELRNGQLG